MKLLLPILVGVFSLLAVFAQAQDADPAEVALGERLFLETRFAEFFARNGAADVNRPLDGGDPAVAITETTGDALPGPFEGLSMNCRSCHLVDEQLVVDALGFPVFDEGGGIRTYADFARRSPVPLREDGATHTPRNSPALVNASLKRRGGLLLHFDGEFATMASLVRGTLTGRNYGWLPHERKRAVAHIARVIRADDGSGELAQEFGGPYRRVFAGDDERVPEELHLPRQFRLDVEKASDEQIVRAVSRLIAIYVEQLEFARDAEGRFVGSPFDRFLLRNSLPSLPKQGERPEAFTRRLEAALDALASPRFVVDVDGPFAFHGQAFEFGPGELAGLRIFLRASHPGDAPEQMGIGNCAACHPAPFFTDFGLHNTGVTQVEYDALHGTGAFAGLEIPSRTARALDPDAFLPPTPTHPGATGRFRAAAVAGFPERTDLGVWNVLGNGDFKAVQGRIKNALKRSLGEKRDKDGLLEASIARFKTPGLRDLGHSGPYMHNGGFDTFGEVIDLYRQSSDLKRDGALRNGAPELADIRLSPDDAASLVAFLLALNEDYD